MRDENVVLRELHRLKSECETYRFMGLLGYFGLLAGLVFFALGIAKYSFAILSIAVLVISVGFLIVGFMGMRRVDRKAARYAGHVLFPEKYQELFQIYELSPEKEIPKYMAQKSGLIELEKDYYGFGFVRAAYRGAIFMASEIRATRWDRRSAKYKRRHRPSERHERLLFDKCMFFAGYFARVDLKYSVNGFLKIEEHQRREVTSSISNSVQQMMAKGGGYRVYDFSGVNPEFQKRFTVTTSDERFAQQFLTAKMMERLVEASKSATGLIKMNFTQDDLFYTNNSKNYYFGVQGPKYTPQYFYQDAKYAEDDIFTFTNVMDIFIEEAPFLFFQ